MGITVILITCLLSGCAYPSYAVDAKRIDIIPDNFIDMSEEVIDEYPHLKETIGYQYGVETPKEEFDALQDFLDFASTDYIKYNDEYFEIVFIYGD